jgi:hypothetical protein
MSKPSAKKLLTGRTIVEVELQPFKDGKGGTAHNPILTLDNGAEISFIAQPTENGRLGVGICYRPPLLGLRGKS